jgi:hypothetical protein
MRSLSTAFKNGLYTSPFNLLSPPSFSKQALLQYPLGTVPSFLPTPPTKRNSGKEGSPVKKRKEKNNK